MASSTPQGDIVGKSFVIFVMTALAGVLLVGCTAVATPAPRGFAFDLEAQQEACAERVTTTVQGRYNGDSQITLLLEREVAGRYEAVTDDGVAVWYNNVRQSGIGRTTLGHVDVSPGDTFVIRHTAPRSHEPKHYRLRGIKSDDGQEWRTLMTVDGTPEGCGIHV